MKAKRVLQLFGITFVVSISACSVGLVSVRTKPKPLSEPAQQYYSAKQSHGNAGPSLREKYSETIVYENGMLVSFDDQHWLDNDILNSIRRTDVNDRIKFVSKDYQELIKNERFTEITIYEIRYSNAEQGPECRLLSVLGNHLGENLKVATGKQLTVHLDACLKRGDEVQKEVVSKLLQNDYFIGGPVMESRFRKDRAKNWELRESAFVDRPPFGPYGVDSPVKIDGKRGLRE